jgi:uncharacterized membrane protein
MIRTEFYVSQIFLTKIIKIIEYSLLIVFFAFNILIFIPVLTGNNFLREGIYSFFSIVCHQKESLSFVIGSHKLSVCSRCTGIYQGFLISGLFFMFFLKKEIKKNMVKLFIIITLLIILLSKIYQYYEINLLTNLIRWLSGFFIGIIFSYPIYYKGERDGRKQINGFKGNK